MEYFGVPTIPACIISIPQEVFNEFKKEGKNYDERYDNLNFDESFFFGSLQVSTTTEMELFNISLKNKYDFNKYEDPIDYIKIGIFDFWIANMDRRIKNPNILINQKDDGLFQFLPIDHTQLFANQTAYKNLRLALMNTPPPHSILGSSISKSILGFTESKKISNFHIELLEGFQSVLSNLEFIFEQVPRDFGLSKKAQKRIELILSDQERNERISKVYHTFVK